ncbi:MAG: lipoprotein [Pseudomonas sp.]|jgi:uncharacterized protein YgiB involved in biofilm formation|nr:lipoprotein [Pseudomonas sp.]
MRRSPAKLVLASTLPLALSACGPSQDEPNFSAQANFKSVQECVEAKVPVDTCSDAYMQAMSDHRRIAPTYDDKASCEADFVPDYCQVTSDGKYMPRLGGFELGFEGNVSKEALEKAQAQVAQSGSGFSGTQGLLTGLLIGNLMSNGFGGGRYYSQPIYQTRDGSSSIPGQMNRGKTFSRSTQAQSSPDSRYNANTLGRNLGASGSRSSVSSTISRGGFGSQAAARSGWGGKSSGSSFGG